MVASHLAAAGYRVAAAARSTRLLDELAAQTGVMPVALDVANKDEVTEAGTNVESTLGPIGVLVNNAGLGGGAGVTWSHRPADWWKIFEVDVLGTFLCCHAVVPGMTARGSGRIVNLASGAALFPINADFDAVIDSSYQARKAAVIHFSEALGGEVLSAGVSVFSISPGMVKSAMTAETISSEWDDPDLWSPPEIAAEFIEFIGSGALDALTGRYIHATVDDRRNLAGRAQEIVEHDLLSMRLREI